jgi:hypothetical protein
MAKAKKEAVEQGLAVAKQFTQDDIPGLLETVNEKIKMIKGGIPKGTKTTGSLEGFGKVSSIETVEDLLKAYSMVKAKAAAFKDAADDILPEGIKLPIMKISGSAPSAWIVDLTARIKVVANKVELDKLIQVKEKLESNLSAKAKLNKDLADIHGILEA